MQGELRTPFKTLRNAECAVHNAEWSAGNSAFRSPNSELPEVLKPALNPEFQTPGIRVLVAAEGSGGHLIPALELAHALALKEASVKLMYVRRPQLAGLLTDLIQQGEAECVWGYPFDVSSCRVPLAQTALRLWQVGHIWQGAHGLLNAFQPQVVVGFGGWFSIPVVLAARQRRIPVLIHEQNVRLGRANRFLKRFADRIALSFESSRAQLNGTPAVITGLPIRKAIGNACRSEAALRFGLDARLLTILILGGSQGSRSLNRLVCQMLPELSLQEQRAWQFVHLTGPEDCAMVQKAYAAACVPYWVAPHLAQMSMAYALADVVLARAGASTVAELARVGKPAILIPYPHAGGHQRENARLVESIGAGVHLEEASVTPGRLLGILRQLLTDLRLRRIMGEQMRTLAHPGAAEALADVVVSLAQAHAKR